jgi:hypothetical protein
MLPHSSNNILSCPSLPSVDLRRVTVVPNEPEAEVVCSLLRAAGIDCSYRPTDIAAEAFGGWQEVLVRAADAERARDVLVARPKREEAR